jgi:hypothetical protein
MMFVIPARGVGDDCGDIAVIAVDRPAIIKQFRRIVDGRAGRVDHDRENEGRLQSAIEQGKELGWAIQNP